MLNTNINSHNLLHILRVAGMFRKRNTNALKKPTQIDLRIRFVVPDFVPESSLDDGESKAVSSLVLKNMGKRLLRWRIRTPHAVPKRFTRTNTSKTTANTS